MTEVDEKAGDLGETQSPNLPAETVLDRVKVYSKAIAAGVAGAVALGIKVATGEDADVGLIDGIEAIVVTLLVYAIPNR